MTPEQFNAFCKSLPATSYVQQWGEADVWKVGGTHDGRAQNKVFAIGAWHHGKHSGITFKVSDIGFEVLKEQPGLRPAPYLASRGMSWIQNYAAPGLNDADLKDALTASHQLVAEGLTKKLRNALGLVFD